MVEETVEEAVGVSGMNDIDLYVVVALFNTRACAPHYVDYGSTQLFDSSLSAALFHTSSKRCCLLVQRLT